MAWLLVLALAIAYLWPRPAQHMRTVIPAAAAPLTVAVRAADDEGKPGSLRSAMAQRTMVQEAHTTGPSPDRLRVEFDQPAEILGVLLSVDITGPHLVELAVGLNTDALYGVEHSTDEPHRRFAARDWLLHVSNSNGGVPSKIDEHVWFPEPFAVDGGDAVVLDAWLGNPNPWQAGVSPELIVFYRWADA